MSGSDTLIVARLRANDSTVAERIVAEYQDRLIALARTHLTRRLTHRISPEDIVQSAMLSFFVRSREGAFHCEEQGDLWRLLASITLNKLRNQIDRHQAEKRDVRRESTRSLVERPEVERVVDRAPTVDDVALVDDELAWLFARIDPLQQRVVTLRLQDWPIAEIAAALGPTERTIRRWLDLAKRLLESRERQLSEPGTATVQRRPNRPPLHSIKHDATLNYRDFLLERQIGRGGMCRVYAAFSRREARRVAVKVLSRDSMRDERQREAFLNEARIVAGFSHPGIVGVHGVGLMPNGSPFMVLDLIAGDDLARVLTERGRFGIEDAIAIGVCVCDALQYAHRLGVVHCDVKPANIIMDLQGSVHVTDFGLARLTAREKANRAHGGTIGFMAPEQLDDQVIGPATDVFGIGALLFSLLTGHAPSMESEFDSQKTANELLALPTNRGDGRMTALAALATRCLATSPHARPQSTREVGDALADIARH